jgi:phasin family protein
MEIQMDQIFANQQQQLETIVDLQTSFLNHLQSFVDLQNKAIKQSIDNITAASQSVLEIKSPQDGTAAFTKVTAPIGQQFTQYSQDLFALMNKFGQDLQTSTESIKEDCQKYINTSIETFSKNSPAFADPMSSYMKSAVAASNKIIDSASKVTTQAMNTAYSNIKATANTDASHADKAKSKAN